MSTASYRFGEFVGTAFRECLRSAKRHTPTIQVVTSAAPAPVTLPAPVVSDLQLLELCQTPAFIRKSGITLNDWFTVNTKESEVKQPRPRKKRASRAKLQPETPEVPRFGSLDELIA